MLGIRRNRSLFILLAIASNAITFSAAPPTTFLKFKREFSSRILNLENEICSFFGLTSPQWRINRTDCKIHRFIKKNLVDPIERLWKKSTDRALSPRFRAIVAELSDKFKRKVPHVVNAKNDNGGDLHFGESDSVTIFIDEESINSHNLSDNQVKSTILHEWMHVNMFHGVESKFLNNFIKENQKNMDTAKLKSFETRFAILQEEIADIFAGLVGGLDIVNAFIEKHEKLISEDHIEVSRGGQCHPKSPDRVKYMKRLRDEMLQDPDYEDGQCYPAALDTWLYTN